MGYEQASPSNRGLKIALIPNQGILQNDGSSSEFYMNDPLLADLKKEIGEIFAMSSTSVQDAITKKYYTLGDFWRKR